MSDSAIANKVLFITFYFPPFDVIGAVRTGKTAAYLQRLGHDVRVLTAKDQGPFTRTLPLEIDERRVTTTSWFGPRRVLDRRVGAGESPTAARPGWRAIAVAALRGVAYFPDAQAGWIPSALTAGARLVREHAPNVILASSGPASSLVVASILARRYSIPWVADLRDLWVDNQNYSFPRWRRPLDLRLQSRVLSGAAGLVTVSEPLGRELERFGRPVEVVSNGYDDADYDALRPCTRSSGDLRIVYTGTIYPRQSPEPLFRAMSMLGERARRIRVVFFGAPASRVWPLAEAHGVRELVELRPVVPRSEALQEQVCADVLLHLLWSDPAQSGVYNAKIFEYLRARRPVLAVGHRGNVTALLVTERRAGLATDDPAAIARQLAAWLDTLESTGAIQSLDAAVSAGFSRREQTERLSRFLNRVVAEAG